MRDNHAHLALLNNIGLHNHTAMAQLCSFDPMKDGNIRSNPAQQVLTALIQP